MFREQRVLAVIPARGGSKGVPRKNLRRLGGRPLVAWSIDTARSEPAVDRVLLSTDDPEIARVGESFGADVPFLRPRALALDETPTLDVLVHALHWLRKHGEEYDIVCLLQPTSPFRPPGLLREALELMERHHASAVVTVRAVPPKFNPHWVFLPGEDGRLRLVTGGRDPIPRRQELPPAVIRDGMLYMTRSQVLLEERSLYGDRCFPLGQPDATGVNLDTLQDFEQAERILAGAVRASAA